MVDTDRQTQTHTHTHTHTHTDYTPTLSHSPWRINPPRTKTMRAISGMGAFRKGKGVGCRIFLYTSKLKQFAVLRVLAY